MFEFVYLIFNVFLFGYLVVSVGGRDRFLYLGGFLIPLNSLAYEGPWLFTWAKGLFFIGLIGYLLIKPDPTQSGPRGKPAGLGIFTIVTIYFLAVSVCWTLFDIWNESSLVVPEVIRWHLGQILNLVSKWGLLIIGFMLVRTEKDLRAALRGLIHGNLANVLAGLYQIVALTYGLPWLHGFWILRDDRFNPSVMSAGIARFGEYVLPRLSGLGGEPKFAAANFVLALLLVLTSTIFSKGNGSESATLIRHNRLGVILLVLGTGLSLSVGSWVAFLVVITYFLLVGLASQRVRLAGLVTLLAAGILVLYLIIGLDTLSGISNQYVVSKFDSLGSYEDTTLLTALAEDPITLIFGRGAGGSNLGLLDDLDDVDRIAGPTYSGTLLLSEFGVTGVILILYLVGQWTVSLFRRGLAGLGYTLLGGFLVTMASHSSALHAFFFIAGAIVAFGLRNPDRVVAMASHEQLRRSTGPRRELSSHSHGTGMGDFRTPSQTECAVQ